MDIMTTEGLVQKILTEDPASRDSDNYLFYKVCKVLLAEQGKDIETMGFVNLFLSLKGYGLPQFETVGRIRRKLQSVHPEFAASEHVDRIRSSNQGQFFEYARE